MTIIRRPKLVQIHCLFFFKKLFISHNFIDEYDNESLKLFCKNLKRKRTLAKVLKLNHTILDKSPR